MSISEESNSAEDVSVDHGHLDTALLTKKKVRRRRGVRLLVLLGYAILFAIGLSIASVICLRWIPPPTSAFMVERYIGGLWRSQHGSPIRYSWVGWKSISPQVPLAVIAAEDQKFPFHWGFDFESISDALHENKYRDRPRGASTITQQVAKNLFLWSGQSYVRKGLEAYFTVLLEILWPKKRILEVYLNIAEFGDGIYGVNAAARSLLGKSPSKLTTSEAALLGAVLPSPDRFKVTNPSPYVIERAQWIEEQMEQLGGLEYLQNL
jgi:monofunctional biosynthetic peptidoglycan transglycosylase